MGEGEMRAESWSGNLRERHHLEDPSLDEIIISKWNFQEEGWGYKQD
jgi:hypothetical protein